MKDCVYSKLIGEVNNQDLPIFATTTMRVIKKDTISDVRDQGLYFSTDDEIVITTEDGGKISENAQSFVYETFTITASMGEKLLFFSNDNYKIRISSKYHIKSIRAASVTNIFGLDLSELNYSSALKSLLVYNTNIIGDLSALAESTDLESINLALADVSGNIKDLSKLTKLTQIAIYNITNPSGVVEEFVAGQISNGRTSVSTPFNFNRVLQFATFGGNKYPAAGNEFISWESTSKITIYDGANDYASCPNIYAKGATAQEIFAWEQAGKTVIVIS